MKVTSVELHPEGSSDVCVLSFRDPRRINPYNVKLINGLDADEIVARYYGGSGGAKYFNLFLEKRELVIKIELNPSFNAGQLYSTLRDNLYKSIASSRTGLVEIQFKNAAVVVAVMSGFISKFESSHFERNQEIQLTVSCSDPMLRAPAPLVVSLIGLDPASTVVADTVSTAPHGFKFDVTFASATPDFNISGTGWSFVVTPAGGFLTGDILRFSSEYNNKYLYITRGATTIHLANVVTPGSIWPILFPGDNTFVVANPTTVTWSLISHYPTYWGV